MAADFEAMIDVFKADSTKDRITVCQSNDNKINIFAVFVTDGNPDNRRVNFH